MPRLPVRALATPAPCVTVPVPATAPDTTKLALVLSTSVSPPAPRITPPAAATVSVASSATAPVSPTATGASLVPVIVTSMTRATVAPWPSLRVTVKLSTFVASLARYSTAEASTL